MEKINGGVRPSIFWCVIFSLFMFSILITYIDFAQFVMPIKTVVQSSTKEYVYSTIEIPLHPSSLLGNNNQVVERISPSSVGNNGEEEDPGQNISFPTNSKESVRDFLVGEQQTKAEVVNNVENGDEYVDMDIDTGNKFEPVSDPCLGKYVYVHNLPSKFNTDLLKDCQALCQWRDMCLSLSNEGLGPSIENSQGLFLNKGWFATDQFALEVIFHNRMKQYKCQTKNSSLASAIYVPFYAGLDISRYLWGGFNTSIRDSTSHELLRWLTSRPEWQRLGGRDHFLVGGRIAWDFRRMTDNDSDWGNNLLVVPELKNMSMLLIESSPNYRNEVAIPYPTYFHPSTDEDVLQWQERMRRQKKRHLFSFAGAPRPQYLESIRGRIIQQCQASSSKCKLLDCSKRSKNVCHDPSTVMKLFQDSIFCLQPPGDSYTRRSAFDSILAGCIPVFFHPASAYTQYIWYLPQHYSKYSVFIPEDLIRNGTGNIEQILAQIPKRQVRAMRKEVIKLIPKVIYADPKSRLETHEDAFDVALKGIIQRVNEVRQKENNMNTILDFGLNNEESKSR